MMMSRKRLRISIDQLESRALLSGFGHHHPGGGFLPFLSPSPAVQADLAKIQQDEQTLHTEAQSLAPTLQADWQAIQTAIQNSTTVQAAKQTLSTDQTAFYTTIKADWQTFVSATDTTARTNALNQLRTDWTNGLTLIRTDLQNVQSAINADPAVQAARQKLQADAAPLTADQATLQADFAQLRTDLQAQAGTNTSTNPA